jgi:dipeptidyl aminopeptidase/acylaminoacyl peptidase
MPERYDLASPLLHIDEDTPPCLVLHGTADVTVPPDQASRFVGAMQGQGLQAQLELYEGAGHGFFNVSPYFEETWQVIEPFVTGVFGW